MRYLPKINIYRHKNVDFDIFSTRLWLQMTTFQVTLHYRNSMILRDRKGETKSKCLRIVYADKKKRSYAACVTPCVSMWTSLGLKFVAMMQLIERMFAVALGGANVNIREITLVKVQTSHKQKKERTEVLSLWTSLGLNQGPPDYESVALTN